MPAGILTGRIAGSVAAGRTRLRTIQETYLLTGSDTDILKAPSRLTSVPDNGLLVIEASSTHCDNANQGKLTVTTPDSEIPVDNQLIPANGYDSGGGILNDNSKEVIEVPVGQGGHVLVSYAETGTVEATIVRFTYYF